MIKSKTTESQFIDFDTLNPNIKDSTTWLEKNALVSPKP